MMASQIVIGNRKAPKIGALSLDCSLDESHVYDSKVTEFPVEDGSVITDHIRNAPIRLDMTGFVTNNPITSAKQKSDISGEEQVGNFVDLAFEALIKIRNERTPVTIVTGLKVYENMAMESMSIPRSASTGDTFRFRASFKEVRIVSTETTKIPDLAPSASDKGASTSDNGTQTAKKSTVEEKKPVSILKGALTVVKNKFIGS